MIISASRRTDIPAFYSDWFLNRIQERYCLVRNPMNFRQVGKIDLSPEVVDCIVFWTKNPRPMMDKLDALKDYPFYFQYTLNAYHADLEAHLPPIEQRIETFRELANLLGKDRIIWRYDPILLNPNHDIAFHKEQFQRLAEALAGYTSKCTISFIDLYRKIQTRMRQLQIQEVSPENQTEIAKALAGIAAQNHLYIDTCVAGDVDLREYGVHQASCIDGEHISRLAGCPLTLKKDRTQRQGCQCVSSIDIGAYNTCLNGCQYCYANHSRAATEKNTSNYDVSSPLLCGSLQAEDTVKVREVKSAKSLQIDFL